MATSTINGIKLTYPDDPCMVFSPCLFSLEGTMARTRVYISNGGHYYTAVYHTPNGGTLDLRQFMQSFFDGLEMGKDLEGITDIKQSELGKTVSLTIMPLDATDTTLAQFNVSIFCVWGAFAVGEGSYYMYRNITWFINFPLTVGIYAPAAGNVNIDAVWGVAIPATPSMVNVLVDVDPSLLGDEFIIRRTYMRMGQHVSVVEYTVKTDDCTEGIYLRWIDRHGFWRYWLFKAGDPSRQAASRYGTWNRNRYEDYSLNDGWQGSSGRRQSFTRNDVQPVCAPLVDQETFDMLQDITTSPCVDMYLGKKNSLDHRWAAVTVQPGTYTKDIDKPEQDFIFNIVMPEIPAQTL